MKYVFFFKERHKILTYLSLVFWLYANRFHCHIKRTNKLTKSTIFICTFPILSIVLKPMLIQIRFWFLLCTLYNRVMRIIKKKFASKLNKCFLRPFGKCKRSSWKVIHYTILKLYYIRIYCRDQISFILLVSTGVIP